MVAGVIMAERVCMSRNTHFSISSSLGGLQTNSVPGCFNNLTLKPHKISILSIYAASFPPSFSVSLSSCCAAAAAAAEVSSGGRTKET